MAALLHYAFLLFMRVVKNDARGVLPFRQMVLLWFHTTDHTSIATMSVTFTSHQLYLTWQLCGMAIIRCRASSTVGADKCPIFLLYATLQQTNIDIDVSKRQSSVSFNAAANQHIQ